MQMAPSEIESILCSAEAYRRSTVSGYSGTAAEADDAQTGNTGRQTRSEAHDQRTGKRA